jgi:ABC-type multidrug transport system permease subunit
VTPTTAAFADIVLTAFAVSALSITLTKSKMFLPVRELFERAPAYLNYLLNCPYCMSHWIALVMAIFVVPGPWWLVWFILVGMSAVISGVILFLIPMGAK